MSLYEIQMGCNCHVMSTIPCLLSFASCCVFFSIWTSVLSIVGNAVSYLRGGVLGNRIGITAAVWDEDLLEANSDLQNKTFCLLNATFLEEKWKPDSPKPFDQDKTQSFVTDKRDYYRNLGSLRYGNEYVPFWYFTRTASRYRRLVWEPVQSRHAMTRNDSKPRLTWD